MHGADRMFVDTNILIYAISDDDEKKSKALSLLEKHPIISLQVIHECSNVLRRKQKKPFIDIEAIIDAFLILTELFLPNLDTVKHAYHIGERYGYSYFDCLMIASAIDTSCAILYSEDMQDNQLISGTLKIINPFSA